MAVEKRNILLTNITESVQYKSKAGRSGNKKIPNRDYTSHAQFIREKYNSVISEALSQKQVAAIKTKGTYAEFTGLQNYELVTKSLENRQSGIRLLNVQTSEDGTTKATIYIPDGKEDFFRKRISQYATEKSKSGNPRHADLIGSIEDIKLAMLESFWTDKPEKLPDTIATNCEIWLRYDEKKKIPSSLVEEQFHNICDELHIIIDKDKRLLFPERLVKMITANRNQLKSILLNCEYITEIRLAEEATTFFINQDRRGQMLWSQDLQERCSYRDTGVSICLLDAGINESHPLIKPAVLNNGIHAVNPDWGTDDNPRERGHGTEMAGIAVYGDLQEVLESPDSIIIPHKLESVKILPKTETNQRELYGAITQQAVAKAEIDNPNTKRVICMAVTAPETPNQDGRPTSWSAALDEIASGSTEEGDNHRLFLVSAGNVEPTSFSEIDYPERNRIEPVQDPAQSWNAISVGGYSKKVEIHDPDFAGFQALAEAGALSPYSTTSSIWKGGWPIKPEVLFDAGNVATNGNDYSPCDDLSLLTTGHRPEVSYYSTIYATSSATAQAANFCAKLYAEYPDLWPETVRALMIHSASWTEQMYRHFCPNGNNSNKGQRRDLLRNCGYGIPDLTKAIQCFDNSVNMIVQDELQPFKQVGSRATMNEMHIHSFPWPKEILQDLGETEIKLKVTLSYFIEPSPGEVGWKDRYRYPSCGLRFEVNKTNQTRDEFMQQISRMMSENETKDDYSSSGAGNNWYLGVNNHNLGSIHSDFIVGNAVDLCESQYVAVFPVGGWWKERVYLGKSENKIRYSLVVSLSTPMENVDLYTPIINQIGTMISVTVPIND